MRRLATRQAITLTGTWGALAGLAAIGAKIWDDDEMFVGTDPRSTDFLKFRKGDIAVDLGAGYGPLLRTLTRLAIGERVDSISGKTRGVSKGIEAVRFARGKLSPGASLLGDLMFGVSRKAVRDENDKLVKGEDGKNLHEFRFEPKGFGGKPITPKSALIDLFAPIPAQTAVELWDEHGARGLAWMIPDSLGLGVSAYGYNADSGNRTYHYESFWRAVEHGNDERASEIISNMREKGFTRKGLKQSAAANKVSVSYNQYLRQLP